MIKHRGDVCLRGKARLLVFGDEQQEVAVICAAPTALGFLSAFFPTFRVGLSYVAPTALNSYQVMAPQHFLYFR
ncbi:MAG TPA: hypothetical protein VN788_11510, partial [Verrucomicrobiae bacterium]|nr:hypothetical protein [Verrucomicrobiae bacterium]